MTNDLAQLIKNLLFIDIETVASHSNLEEVSERLRYQWGRKATYLRTDSTQTDADLYDQRAGIYAEFGRVIVIGMGVLHTDENGLLHLRTRTLANTDEKALLEEFAQLLENRYDSRKLTLCAHNGREFDYPYICRRMLVNGVNLPQSLQLANRKPWEINHLDTLELWKFGDRKNYTSLDLLAALFDIPSSKTDLSGDQVNSVFYNDNDLLRIQHYCAEDVIVLAQLFLKYQNQPLVASERIARLA